MIKKKKKKKDLITKSILFFNLWTTDLGQKINIFFPLH